MPAYYSASFEEFLRADNDVILAQLTAKYAEDRYRFLETLQVEAWRDQIIVLKRALAEVIEQDEDSKEWSILFEFLIPRRMGRIDTVLLINQSVLVLEFKKGVVDAAAIHQVEDYALDLLHFHKPTRDKLVVPLVIGGRLVERSEKPIERGLRRATGIKQDSLSDEILNIGRTSKVSEKIDRTAWDNGEYCPVPTVLEAAIAMFSGMEVDDIARAETDPINLTKTIEFLKKCVLEAKKNDHKVICFVTGVPGAGKTLAGLKLVHDPGLRKDSDANIAFLSGNAPLVKILRSALALDQRKRKALESREAARDPKTLIQGVYGFKNSMWMSVNPPDERVLVFDEAQRAWDQPTNVKKLKGNKACAFSEPALILDVMSRHKGWAVLIALIGGGQEIHVGEAGLREWGITLEQHFPLWQIFASPEALKGRTPATTLFGQRIPSNLDVTIDSRLHLDNPTRQFRGKTVATWVDWVLQAESNSAREALLSSPDYSISLTRKLDNARQWLQQQSRGSERYGLVASSGSGRLRAYGIETASGFHKNIPIDHWFLKDSADVRSSYKMEVAATEFEIQGLELDWVGLCWGGDFLVSPEKSEDKRQWEIRHFLGARWTSVKRERAREYVINTYRVLLTRARQGMVIFVPPGSADDPTLDPIGYDRTADFLVTAGAKLID